jgi:hypothetical protein
MLDRAIKVFQFPVLIIIAMLGIVLFPISILVYILFDFGITPWAVEKLVKLSN